MLCDHSFFFISFFPFDLMQSDVGESSGQRRMIQILARMQMRFVMECMGSFDIFLKSVLGTWVVFCHYVISPCNTFFFWPTGTDVFRSASIEKGYRRCITVSYKRPFSFKDFFPEIDNYFLGIHGDELWYSYWMEIFGWSLQGKKKFYCIIQYSLVHWWRWVLKKS